MGMGELGAVVVFVSLRESCQAFVIGTHVKVMTAIFSAVSKGKKKHARCRTYLSRILFAYFRQFHTIALIVRTTHQTGQLRWLADTTSAISMHMTETTAYHNANKEYALVAHCEGLLVSRNHGKER